MVRVELLDHVPKGMEMPFVIIAARYRGKWVLVRHKERNTYEIPGGHIEPGEHFVESAKRELYEETGAINFSLKLISAYSVTMDEKTSGGYLFFAEITALSELPQFESEEIQLFDNLPNNLTYPLIQPQLFKFIQEYLKKIPR